MPVKDVAVAEKAKQDAVERAKNMARVRAEDKRQAKQRQAIQAVNKEEKGLFETVGDFFETVYDGVGKALTQGGKATGIAVRDGLKAAGVASQEVVNQYKNNESFRNAFNTALAAGMAPKAAAAYAVGGGAAIASAYRAAMQRGAAKAVSIPGAERAIKEGYDFITAHDPMSAPNPTIGGLLGTFRSGKKDLYKSGKEIYEGIKKWSKQ